MSERINLDINHQTVREISAHLGLDGDVESRLLEITNGEKVYLLRVGLPRYIVMVKDDNDRRPDTEPKRDENIFSLPDLESFEVVVEALQLVAIHPENLAEYLEELDKD